MALTFEEVVPYSGIPIFGSIASLRVDLGAATLWFDWLAKEGRGVA